MMLRWISQPGLLMNALLAGTPAERIRAKMAQLESRQKQLEAELATAAPAPTTRLHARIADSYHDRIRSIVAGLTEPDAVGDAHETIRGRIERIVLTLQPTSGKTTRPPIELVVSLAAILRLSMGEEGVA